MLMTGIRDTCQAHFHEATDDYCRLDDLSERPAIIFDPVDFIGTTRQKENEESDYV